MSVHIIDVQLQDQPARITMGYDRPMQWVFMVVQYIGAEDTPVYSNMDEPDPHSLTLEDFRKVLDDLNVSVPDILFHNVQQDANNNVGNKNVFYKLDGSFTVS